MGGGIGGAGITPGAPDAAAGQARGAAPTDLTGFVSKTKGDQREESHNQVSHTEGNSWIEVKGSKGEFKMGAFLELIVGMKHTMVGGIKTGLDLAYNKTFDLGPCSTEMLAAKYERLGSKNEKVMGEKKETWTGYKYEKTTGSWKEANAKKREEAEAQKKAINDALNERAGAMFQEKAASCKEKADKVRETITALDRKVSQQMRVECEKARDKVNQYNRDISQIKMTCD